MSEQGRIEYSQNLSLWGDWVQTHLHRSHHYTNAPPLNCNLRFLGQYEDKESGLYYNRYLYYNPTLAQYISPDPIGLLGGFNPYGYVAIPTGWVDPLGLAACPTLVKDSLGRVKEASVTVTKEMIGTGTGVNKSARAYAKAIGNQGDDAGHILAKVLGGQGGKGNVFPQLKEINRGQYRIFEKQIREKLGKSDSPLDLKWMFKYHGLGKRPTGVQYDVYQDGKKVLESFFENI